MRNKLGIAFLLVALFGGCKTPKRSTVAVSPNTEMVTDIIYRKPIVDKALFKSVTELVPIDNAYISKDTLHILTGKITGCNIESFKLVWNGIILKTQPPQSTIKLLEVLDPACREKHRFHLTYKLTPFQTKSDTAINKATILDLGGWKSSLKYAY